MVPKSINHLKWGGYYPKHLAFRSHGEVWEMKFFASWRAHGALGLVSEEFKNFEVAYYWLVNEYPLFDQYIAHCEDYPHWEWEKDGSGTHQFDRYMQYVPNIINARQRELDNPDCHKGLVFTEEHSKKIGFSKAKPVLLDGIWYPSITEAQNSTGLDNLYKFMRSGNSWFGRGKNKGLHSIYDVTWLM